MEYLPQDRQYTRDDVWLRADGDGLYTLGLTHFGQNELGELVYVELPSPNRPVKAGQSVAVVESVKSVSEVYCPVAGTIVGANARVGQTPEMVNESPYDEGWIARLRVEETPELLSPQQYAAWRRLDEN